MFANGFRLSLECWVPQSRVSYQVSIPFHLSPMISGASHTAYQIGLTASLPLSDS